MSNSENWHRDYKYPPAQFPPQFPGTETANTSGTLTEFYLPPMQEMDAEKRRTKLHEMYAGPPHLELEGRSARKGRVDLFKKLPPTPVESVGSPRQSVISPRSP